MQPSPQGRTQKLQLADNVSHVTMHGYLIEQGGRKFLQHILTDLPNIHIHRFSHRGGDTQALEVAVCEFNGLIRKINDMNRKLYIPNLWKYEPVRKNNEPRPFIMCTLFERTSSLTIMNWARQFYEQGA